MKVKDVEYPQVNDAPGGKPVLGANLSLLKHVDVNVEVRMGQASLRVAELMALQTGAVLKLDRLVDEPVEVLLNGCVVAHGQLAVLGDHLGVRITGVQDAENEIRG